MMNYFYLRLDFVRISHQLHLERWVVLTTPVCVVCTSFFMRKLALGACLLILFDNLKLFRK